MSTDPNFLPPGVMALLLALVIAFFTAVAGFFTAVVSFFTFALSVWAIRTAKSPADRKALTEVAKRAVSSSPLRGLIKWPESKEGDDGS